VIVSSETMDQRNHEEKTAKEQLRGHVKCEKAKETKKYEPTRNNDPTWKRKLETRVKLSETDKN